LATTYKPVYTLQVKCPDQPGLIYKITKALFDQSVNIISQDEFVDKAEGSFFTRATFEGSIDELKLKAKLIEALSDAATINIIPKKKKKIVVLATKEHHCLADLLTRNHFNELNADIQAVISNHNHLKELTEKFDVPYHHISTKALTRVQHETKVREQLSQYSFDFIVLAKYMRILLPEFVSVFKDRIINIHHSFLPSFIGANPYRQAFNRGVKIIGATAHFVTDDLDEGPIIEQGVMRINHTMGVKAMAAAGKNVERDVLIKALNLVFNDKVMLNGRRTVVFH